MYRRYLFALLVLAAAFIFGLVWRLAIPSPAKPPETRGEYVDPLQSQIEEMSLEQKVGQLVIVGLEGYDVDNKALELIETYHVGGFIFYQRNIRNLQQTVNLVNSLKEANAVNGIPLFLSVDEEGGRVSRIPDAFLKIPSAQKIGEMDDSELSFEVGRILGDRLNAVGLNMDFAPVLDVNSNPENPVIGDRAFGSEADIVSRLGIKTMKGLQDRGVISVVKHFPGHGDTAVDSHVGLPMVDHNLQRLQSFELVPFAGAIANGADAIMVAHILLPEIDSQNPASFSRTLISSVLRTQMNFDGLVITDDMTMGAIVENWDIAEAAVAAINAGTDIILVGHDYEKQKDVVMALRQAAGDGFISAERIDRSVYRVLQLKRNYELSDRKVEEIQPTNINEKIRRIFPGI